MLPSKPYEDKIQVNTFSRKHKRASICGRETETPESRLRSNVRNSNECCERTGEEDDRNGSIISRMTRVIDTRDHVRRREISEADS